MEKRVIVLRVGDIVAESKSIFGLVARKSDFGVYVKASFKPVSSATETS